MDPTELFPWLFGGGMVLTIVTVIGSVIISLLCTIVPIVAVVMFIRKRSQQKQAAQQASQQWPSTTGRVLKSRVEVSGGDTTSVTPYVLYEYEVQGRAYQCAQIQAGDQFLRSANSRQAYTTIDRYPVGAIVRVYYNPANPAEAALER